MKPNPCIVILAYPNTDKKLSIMMDSIRNVKDLNLPIFVFSNMNIDEKYLIDCDFFIYTGNNDMWSASDVLNTEQISVARNQTKYRHHLVLKNSIISYVPINYGTEKSYYWALTNLYRVAFDTIHSNGFTHFFLLQYDTILDEKNIILAQNYINEMYSSKLDAIIAVDPGMGDNHMNDYAFFGKTSYWNDMFKTTSIDEFYNLTFPNWTIEEYYYKKCKLSLGNVKIKVRTDLDDWEKDFYSDLPQTWEREDIDCNTREPIHLLFPNLEGRGLSNYWETPTFDIEKSLIVSIGNHKGDNQIFVWNKQISDFDQIIEVKITFISDSNSSDIPPITLSLNPGVWFYRNNLPTLIGRRVEISYSYFEDDKKIDENKTYNL
jgi:hypothetical protein